MNTKPDPELLLKFARHLASCAGDAIKPHFRSKLQIDTKPAHHWDPVTEGDKAAERAIRALIEQHYPDHGIIGEEYGTKPAKSDFTWILDPIDGTRAFVIGMPTWMTLIGLYYQDKPFIGVAAQPFVGDIFFGGPHGSWLDHRGTTVPLRASQTRDLKSALVGTTAPHTYRNASDRAGLAAIDQSCRALRYGGDAYFFSLVAAGSLDVAMDAGVQIYDIAALIPIVEGAGGHVGEWRGLDPAQGGNLVMAATRDLLEETMDHFKP